MKHGILKYLLLAAMPLFFDGGEGGGTGDGDGASDNNNSDNSGGTTSAQSTTTTATPQPEVVSISKEQFESIQQAVGEMATERAITKATEDIAARVPDFKLSEVHAHLKELHKTDPARAEALNNPAGWEMVWKAEIAPARVEADAVNHGRKAADDPERDGIVSKLRSGDGSIYDRAKLYEKYL